MGPVFSTFWMRDLAARQRAGIQPLTARTLLKPMLGYCSAHWHEDTLELARHALAAAQLYIDLAEPDEALGFLGKALPLLERHAAQANGDLSSARLACGHAHLQADKPSRALDHLLAAAADPALFDTDAEAPELALKLALAFASLRAPAAGLPFARWALGFQQREHAMLHVRTAVASFIMAQLLRAAAPPTPETRSEREVFLRRAVSTLRQTRNDDAVLGHALIALGELHDEDGDHDSAVSALEEAVGVAGLSRGPRHPQTVWARAALGGAQARAGRKEAADAMLREALAASRQQPVENGDLLEAILEPLARLSYDLLRLSDHIEFTDELKRVRLLRGKRAPTGPLRDVTPDRLPAFHAVSSRHDGGDRKLAWLG